MFAEAWLLLAGTRWALSRQPFKQLVHGVEKSPGEAGSPEPAFATSKTAVDVGWAVRTAARYTPWESACLVQALVAQKMLQSRGIATALTLGTKREEEGDTMAAHAWLKVGSHFVTGESGHQSFAPVATFCTSEWSRDG